MATIIVRDVPEPVVKGIDEQAAQERLSRSEYIRRLLAEAAKVELPPFSSVEEKEI